VGVKSQEHSKLEKKEIKEDGTKTSPQRV